MKIINAKMAKKIFSDSIEERKRSFINQHEKLLNEFFNIIEYSSNNLKCRCTFLISKDRITDSEAETFKMLVGDWEYGVSLLPNYITAYAFDIWWTEE